MPPELFNHSSILVWVGVVGCVLCLQAAFTVALEKHPTWKFHDAFKHVFYGTICSLLGTVAVLAVVWLLPPLLIEFSDDDVDGWQFLATAATLVVYALLHYFFVIAKIRHPPKPH